MLLMLPRLGGAHHANGHNDRSRYCEVGISGAGVDAEGKVLNRRRLRPERWRAKWQKNDATEPTICEAVTRTNMHAERGSMWVAYLNVDDLKAAAEIP